MSDVDRVIEAIAARRHGVVARFQLLDSGVSPSTIDHRIRRGRLVVMHRGVYKVGPISGELVREMGASLACGPSSVISYLAAGSLHEVLPALAPDQPIDVSVPRSLRGPSRGVRLHRVGPRVLADAVERKGLRVTSPARTLVDLAGILDPSSVERVFAKFDRAGSLSVEALRAYMACHPGRPGARVLHAMLDLTAPDYTRSAAERRFLSLVRTADMRKPSVNAIVERLEVDFLWRRERLIVEIDGYEYHRGRAAFERDHGRDGVLVAAGFTVMRVTWTALTRTPMKVVAQVAQALGEGAARSGA